MHLELKEATFYNPSLGTIQYNKFTLSGVDNEGSQSSLGNRRILSLLD